MAGLWQDVRYALRTLGRQPGSTLAIVMTLALGIGANTAIFSMVNGVLLRSLPYQKSEQLVTLRQHATDDADGSAGFSVPEVVDYREQSRSLAGVVEYHTMWFNLIGSGEPQRVQTGVVSADFFDVMGVRPVLGRTFVAGDDAQGAEAVLVLSYGYWQRAFGGEKSVIGRTVEMNDRVHTIVGVLPPVPQYPNENDVYMPTTACPFRRSKSWTENRGIRPLTVFARLKDGVTPQAAQSDVAALAARLRAAYPNDYPPGPALTVAVTSLQEELTRKARPTLLVLLATAGFVLLIACANVANLSLVRLSRRDQELAVRTAFGAGRGRLARQLLTESTLVALVGGGLGLLLAAGGMDLLASFAARFTPRAHEIHLDGAVLAFTVLVSVATGLAFGSFPAAASSDRAVSSLKEGGRTTASAGSSRLRTALIVAQLAISFVLLVGAGLMVKSLIRLQQVRPGFDAENVLTVGLDLDFARFPPGSNSNAQSILALMEPMLERTKGEPGVLSAALAGTFPLAGGQPFVGPFLIEGRETAAGRPRPQADFRIATPDYFRTVGIPLRRGRAFAPTDRQGTPVVVMLNESLAQRYWPGEDPIGRRISTDNGQTWDTVVGIVGDVKQYGLDTNPADEMYYPYFQVPLLSNSLLLRTRGDPMALLGRVRAIVRSLDRELPIGKVQTLQQARSESLSPSRLTTLLLAIFAGLALVIAATGIGGVIAFAVAQRTHEIGIRMALGAARGDVLCMVLRQGLGMIALGIALGAAGALALSRMMSGLLFGVEPTDPLTFVGVAALLVGVAAAACIVPARQAAGVAPMLALRTS